MPRRQKAKPDSQKSDKRKHHGPNTTRGSFIRFGDGTTQPTAPWKVNCSAYMGTSNIKEPYDAKQSELNRLAGFWS